MRTVNIAPIEYQLLVDDKNGNVFELPVTGVTWKTQRTDRAGSLEFEFMGGDKFADSSFSLSCGDLVRFEVNGETVFYGYVFSIDRGSSEAFSATAYDQMRYLMYSDTYVFTGKTATEIIKQIAGEHGVALGTIAETGYAIPTLSQDNQKLLDIMTEALSETTYNTGRTYVLYDDCGKLTLTDIEDMRLDIVLGDYSMLTGYEYSESIDGETYDVIKLAQDNGDSGSRVVYVYKDSANIAKWGALQYYESVDSEYNTAMINQRGEALLALRNKLEKTFKLEARGDVSCRAGKAVYVEVAALGAAQFYVIESADHSFEGNDYSMSLELRAVD